MSTEPESRLIDEPEFCDLLEAARTIDVEDEWLDTQLDKILEKLEPPTPPGGGTTGTGGGSSGGFALNALKLFAPLIIGVGIYIALSPKSDTADTTLSISKSPPAQQPDLSLGSDSQRDGSPSSIPKLRPKLREKPLQSTLQGLDQPSEIAIKSTMKVGSGPGRAEAPPETDAASTPSIEATARRPTRKPTKIPAADLGNTLKIMKEARRLAENGALNEAFELLRPLLETTYRPEALRVQAELAYQFGRFDIAVESLQVILTEPNHDTRSKRSFLRRLGDALAKQRSCGEALLTYQKALKLAPPPEEADAIRAAMVRCR